MLLDRISKRITPTPGGCWEWSGTHNGHGYGMVWLNDRMRVTHRVVFESLRGPVPDGLELDHLCQNKGCCNPDHLEPVTRNENLRRTPRAQRLREQTHCARRHRFTDDNTYFTKQGRRCCKACRRINQRNYLDRKAN